MFVIPVGLMFYKKFTDDLSWIELHQGDYDLVALLFVIMQVLIRNIVISMKYGTTPERVMHRFETTLLNEKEIDATLLSQGWITVNPASFLKEVEESVVR